MTVSAPRYVLGAAPGGLPGVGHALSFFRDPLSFLVSLPAYGDLVRIKLGTRPIYVACHPDLVHQMLTNARTFDKGGMFIEKARLVGGDGLATSEWLAHRWQRRMMQPAFRREQIANYVTVMADEARALAESWRPGQTIELKQALHSLTIRILSRALLGVDTRYQDDYDRYFPDLWDGTYQRMVVPVPLWFRVPTPAHRRFSQAQKRLRDMTAEIIEEHRRKPANQVGMVATLLEATDELTGHPLTDEQIHDQLLTLMVTGTDTTTNNLAFTFHLLGQHPEIESRLHSEIDDVVAGGTLGWADLPRLEYTRRVIYESLRLYPPVWFLTRITTAATQLGRHLLPAGVDVAYSPYILHRHPDLFPDFEQFDPDRWLPERARTIPRGAMIPFSEGNRKCIGDHFGWAENLLAVATIAARWRLRPVPGTTMRPKAGVGLGPGQLLMTCQPRQ